MKKRFAPIIIFFLLLGLFDWGIASFLQGGVDRYFGLNRAAGVLLVGHSHLMLAVDKEGLERELGLPVAKYCREGVNVQDRLQMTRHYFSQPESRAVKCVLYGVDPFMFTEQGLSRNSYKLFYPFMEDPVMDRYIREQAGSLYDYWLHKLFRCTRYSDALVNSALRGWFSNWENYKYGVVSPGMLQEGSKRPILFEENLVETFLLTLRELNQCGVRVILVNTPVIDKIRLSDPVAYERCAHFFKKCAETGPMVDYIDYNPRFSGRYELFYDLIHLNVSGMSVITKELAADLKKLNI